MRFQHEARVAASLRHPNIVTIYEVGEDQGSHYIAMECLPGLTLAKLVMQDGALVPDRVVSMVEQVASALDYAHSRNLVHRDVKPSNIIVGPDGHATLTDFGLVKAAEGTKFTTTGQILGTPEYMSPEQAEGLGVDWRSDIYSLGIVAFEMCTGAVPFSGKNPSAILYKHVHEPPPRPRTINSDISAQLEGALLVALRKNPAERYQTATALARALKGESVLPPEPIPEPKPVLLDVAAARPKAQRIIRKYMALAGGTAVATGPVPGTSIALAGLEAKMIFDIARAYGHDLTLEECASIGAGIVAASGVLKGAAVELSTFVPGVGWVIKGGIAAGAAKAIGELAIKYFEGKSAER